MKYFVGAELGVANLLQRNFDWVANSLWFEEIPNARDPSKTFFVLGGKDSILHSQVSCCHSLWLWDNEAEFLFPVSVSRSTSGLMAF
jgi:hypothetical protein